MLVSGLTMKRGNKFGAVRTAVSGDIYDSRAEAKRGQELELLVRAGKIRAFRRQVTVPLVVNGVRVAAMRWDFEIDELDGSTTLEEVKGFKTEVFRLKYALFKALYPERKHSIVWV